MNIGKKCKLAGLLFGLALMMNTASAAFLVEPHIGYNISASGDNGKSGVSKIEYDYNGAQLGLRAGYQELGFMAGLDFTRSTTFKFESKTVAGTSSVDMDRNELGVFVGYNLPILLRAWAAYYFMNNSEDQNKNEYSGNTTELGVGFTALPFLSLNLMYRMINMDEFETSGGAKSNIDISTQEIVFGVSLPLTL